MCGPFENNKRQIENGTDIELNQVKFWHLSARCCWGGPGGLAAGAGTAVKSKAIVLKAPALVAAPAKMFVSITAASQLLQRVICGKMR